MSKAEKNRENPEEIEGIPKGVEGFEEYYLENFHHKPDLNSGIGATMQMMWNHLTNKHNKELEEYRERCESAENFIERWLHGMEWEGLARIQRKHLEKYK